MYSVADLLASHGFRSGRRPTSGSSTQPALRMELPRSGLEQGFPGQDTWHDGPPAARAACQSSLPLQEHDTRADPLRERAELVRENASYEEGQVQHQGPPVTIRNFENQLPLLEGSEQSVSYWRRRGQDFSVLLDYTNHQPPLVDVSPPAYLAGLRDQPPSYHTVQHGPFNQTAVSREANPPPYPAVSRDPNLPLESSGLHSYTASAEALPRPSSYPQPPPYKAEPQTLELSQKSAPQTTQLQQNNMNLDYALLTDQNKDMSRNGREKGNSKYVSSHCSSDYQDMSGMYYSSSQYGQDSKDVMGNAGKGSTSLEAKSDAHILYTGKQYFEPTPLPTEKVEKPQTFRPPPPTYEMYQLRSKDCYKAPLGFQLKNVCCHLSTHENGQYKSSAEFSPDRLFIPPESQMKYQTLQLPTYVKPPDYISQYKENTSHQNQPASNVNSIGSTGENKQKLKTARVEYIPFTDPRVRIVPKAHWEIDRQNQDNGQSVRKSINDKNSVNYIHVKEGLDKQLLHSKQIPPPSLVSPVLNQDSYIWRNSQSNHEINKQKMQSDDTTYMQLKYPANTSSVDHAFHSRKGHIQETGEHRSLLHVNQTEDILQGDLTHEASGGQMSRSLLGVRTGVHQRGAVGETVFCLISVPSQSVDVDQGGIWLPDVSNSSSNAVPAHSHQHTQSASELELQALTGKMIAEEEACKAKEKVEEKARKHACESQILSHPLKFSSELKGEAKMYDTRQKPQSQKHQLNNVTLHCVPKQLHADERTFVSQKNRQIHGHAIEVEDKHFQTSNCGWKTQNTAENTSILTGDKKNEESKNECRSKTNGKQIQIIKEDSTKVSYKGNNKSWQNRETGKRGTNCSKEKFNSKYFYKVKSLKEPASTHSQTALQANAQVSTITLKGNSLADSFSFGQFLLRPVGRRPWDVVSELENINRELQDDPEEQDHDPSIQRPQDVYQRFHVLMPSGQKDEITHTLERRKSEPNLSELPSSQYERSQVAWGSKNSHGLEGYSSPHSSQGSSTNKVDGDGNEHNTIQDNLKKENFHQKGPSERLLRYNRSHGNDLYMSVSPSSSLQRRHRHSEPDLTALIASQELEDKHEDQSELGFTSTSLKESLAERAARILGISISEDALLAPDSSTATESKDVLTMELDGNICDITTGTEKTTHKSHNLFGAKQVLLINGHRENEHSEPSKHVLQTKNKCDSHKDNLKKPLIILCKEELTSYTSTNPYESCTQEEMSSKYANGNRPDRKTDHENTIMNPVVCVSGDQYSSNITDCVAEPRFYSSCSMIFSPIKIKSENTIHVEHIKQSKSPLIENVCSMKGECEDCSDIPGCLCLVKDDGFVDSLSKHESRNRQLNECNWTALAEHANIAWEYTNDLKAAASDDIKDNGHGLDLHGCLPLHAPTIKTNTEATNNALAVDVICS